MPIPAIIPAIIAAAGAIGGAGIQAASAKKNRESQERQNAIDRQRAATAYRTAVSDMRAAGMNPITGQNPPQAASTPMPAPQSDMTGVGQVLQQGASAIGDLMQRNQQALQDQSLGWYQNQVTTTNDMINKLQDVIKDYNTQMNQSIQGLSEDAKSYLKSIEEEYQTSIQKLSEISDTQMFSVEQLNKLGITVADSETNETSDTEHEKSGHEYKLGITSQFSLKQLFGISAGAGGLWTGEEGKEHTKKNFKTKSAQGQIDISNDTKYVSGKEVKNAVQSHINQLFKSKLEDSGSKKINENLTSIDRDSYIRLSRELIDSKLQLRKYRDYADYLRNNPGESLKSYRGFIDAFKNNDKNPFDLPNYASYHLELQKQYGNKGNYPSAISFVESHPKFFDSIIKEIEAIDDPEDRDRLLEIFTKNVKEYKKKLEDAKKGIFVF